MKVKQRFFSEPGYQPRAYGYGRVSHKNQYDSGNSLEDQERRIVQYYQLKVDAGLIPKNSWCGMFAEPRAQSAYSRAFRDRPMGKKLVKLLKPGDILIVDKLDRIFRTNADYAMQVNWFIERGIDLHLINFMGSSISSASKFASVMVGIQALFAEHFSADLSDKVCRARAARRAQGKHGGGAIPWFCELVGGDPTKKRGGGGRLKIKPDCLKLMMRIHEHLAAGGTLYSLAKEVVAYGRKPTQDDHRKLAHLRDFYAAWLEAGQPDINELKVMDLIADYRRRKRERDAQPGAVEHSN